MTIFARIFGVFFAVFFFGLIYLEIYAVHREWFSFWGIITVFLMFIFIGAALTYKEGNG